MCDSAGLERREHCPSPESNRTANPRVVSEHPALTRIKDQLLQLSRTSRTQERTHGQPAPVLTIASANSASAVGAPTVSIAGKNAIRRSSTSARLLFVKGSNHIRSSSEAERFRTAQNCIHRWANPFTISI